MAVCGWTSLGITVRAARETESPPRRVAVDVDVLLVVLVRVVVVVGGTIAGVLRCTASDEIVFLANPPPTRFKADGVELFAEAGAIRVAGIAVLVDVFHAGRLVAVVLVRMILYI